MANKIADISRWQKSSAIDWPRFSKELDLLFIRVQYGSTGPDAEYPKHSANAAKHGVPFYSYAFPRFINVADARIEARDAAQRQHSKSLGMVIDLEPESSSGSIASLPKSVRTAGIKAFVDELRDQGVKRVGAYVAHHVYKSWDFADMADLFDFVWIPSYGANDGSKHSKPDYPCDLWQYTSVGRVDGYGGNIDLNVLTGRKSLDWFVGENAKPKHSAEKPKHESKPKADRYKVRRKVKGYKTAADAKKRKHSAGHVKAGNYYVFNESAGMVNVTRKAGVPGSWINPADNKPKIKRGPGGTYRVKSGDTLSVIGAKKNVDWHDIADLNDIRSPYTIFPGEKLKMPKGAKKSSKPKSKHYTVKSGDTLSGIGAKLDVSWKKLAKKNGIKAPYTIYPGQKIKY